MAAASTPWRLGVDLGGTKIEAVVLEGDRVAMRRRVATPSGGYDSTLQALVQLIAELEAAVGLTDLPVGLGHPGSISPHTGLLRNANSTCLNGRPLKQDLEALLGRPVRMANDANCMALSEAYNGAAQGATSAFLVILGTGVGGAWLLDGKLQVGANALAGEWGHNPLPWMSAEEFPGTQCWCGQRSCLETWLSGPALERCHANAGGDTLQGSQIVLLAAQGHTAARATLERYTHRLARALASVINLLDPEIIVLAGGLSNIRSLYEEVPRLWGQWVFAEEFSTRLVPAHHGDASGVLGAARLDE